MLIVSIQEKKLLRVRHFAGCAPVWLGLAPMGVEVFAHWQLQGRYRQLIICKEGVDIRKHLGYLCDV